MIRRRLRKFILWTGTLLCVLIAAAFVVAHGPAVYLMAIVAHASYVFLVAYALLVWWFWPKPPKPGHCRCGYNLTGNTSGVCPECGVEVHA